MSSTSSNIQLCYQCGKCTAICPVRRVVMTTPRSNIYQTNVYRKSSDDIWNCLTCGLCYDGCPQGVDYPEFVKEEREGKQQGDLVHKGVFTLLSDLMADLKESKTNLAESGNNDSKIGYYPGCLDFHDMFFDLDVDFKSIADSSMKLLEKMDMSAKMLQLKCCGHDQLWQGDTETFEKLKEQNTKLIKESGIETLVTSCAECYRTLSMDYDLPCEVVHISQLLKNADLGIDSNTDVTCHDACRLGRHMGEYDAPREALSSAGATVTEMAHSKNESWCCGVSTMMSCNDRSKALRKARLDEAKDTEAKVLITSCPKCLAHLNCMKTEQESVENYEFDIKDLTVFLAEQLGGK
ncbi:MAG: (Fe-S)-binding protein [Methanosarcinales archaeon]|nr:(Fe-S)-binding protein [Methanosarcinales archaeon]